MRRFAVNRWWTFILALVLGVAGVVVLHQPSFADDGVGGKGLGSSGDDLGPGVGPDPQGAGDPDSPSSSGLPSAVAGGGSANNYGRIGAVDQRGVGDAAGSKIAQAWMRVRFALGVFKYYYLRF